jgi:hypothetical protein
MTKQTELLEFLTRTENLPFVVDILKQGDQIRCLLLNRFMRELKCYLEDHATAFTEPSGSTEWELAITEETNDVCATLGLRTTSLPQENQYLKYSVEHSAESESEMVVCLAWKDEELWKKSKLQKLKAVVQIGEHLKSQGFKKGRRWLRYRFVREDNSLDEFLADIIDEERRKSLFRQIGDCFWPLVQHTHEMVAAANKAIAENK